MTHILNTENIIPIVSGIKGFDVDANTNEKVMKLLDVGNKILDGKTDYQKEIAFMIFSLSDEEVGANYFELRTISVSNPVAWINIVHDLGIAREDRYLSELALIRGNHISDFSKATIEELERDLGINVLSITQKQWKKWYGYLIKKRFRVDFESTQKTIPSNKMIDLMTLLGTRDI